MANEFGSMAQDALGEVNGGESVQSPGGVVANSGDSENKLKSQMDSAFNIARKTVKNLSSGLQARFGAGFSGRGVTGFQPMRQQGGQYGATGQSGLFARFLGQQQPAGVPLPQNPGMNADGFGLKIDTRPLNEQMKMIRPVGGGAAIPHYDYNGVSVALPDGVDANDINAVRTAMAEQNELIDMMNGMNDEED